MQRARIKICGITCVDDALAVANAGVDAIGLVFHEQSPRAVDVDSALAIAAALPPFVSKVGLFVNAETAFINEILGSVKLDIIQFHGIESPAQCRSYKLPYIKAINVVPGMDYHEIEHSYADAAALLLDSHVEGTPGGTGLPFDWKQVPLKRNRRLILAGGLDAENVGMAIKQVHPYAVDVSSGVEASKGKKSIDRVEAFIRAVQEAN